MDSILLSVKKHIGVYEDECGFDDEIVQAINSTFFKMYQLGIGPNEPFEIEQEGTCWDEFIVSSSLKSAVKQFVCKRVKLEFDPPTNSTLLAALQDSLKELEWRLLCERETNKK